MTRNMLALGALVALYSPVAQAAETGGIRGRVLDGSGLAVPGAQVTISGASFAGELTVQTDAGGRFSFYNVPLGSQDLTIVHEGFAPVKATVAVRLDETSFVPVTMQPAGAAAEEIIVEEELPVVDATRSAFSSEMSSSLLENVPVGRSYQDAVNMLPGVYGRVDTVEGGPGSGNPSVRGEGSYGNNYLLDGISTRDPATKTFMVDVNFDSIDDIQVYTDGLPAEFGQATGMLVNVVTKDGGDEHFGTAGFWGSGPLSWGQYDIADLEAHQDVPTDKRRSWNGEFSGTAGGPIVREHLWYFAALGLDHSNSLFEGQEKPLVSDSGSLLAKLTWFPSADAQVQYMFNGQYTGADNYETSSQFTDEAQARYTSFDMVHTLTARWRPFADTELEVKGNYVSSSIDVVPMSGDLETPQVVDLATGKRRGNYDSFDYNDRTRIGGTFHVTQVLDGFLGDHRFKAGAEYFVLGDSRELVFTGPRGTNDAGQEYAGRTYRGSGQDYPCTAASGYTDCYGYVEYVDVGAIAHKGDLFTTFIQDDWTLFHRLTLNVGLRVDRETLFSDTGGSSTDPIVDQWMPAPRLGLAWDVTGDSRTLVSANYGRYYDINGNSFADWGDTRSAFVFREYEYDADTGQYDLVWEQDPAQDPLIYCSDSPDLADLCTTGGLRPYHTDKLAVGIERELFPLFSVGLRGIWSQTTDIPEDVDLDLDNWVIMNSPYKRRDYRAIELTAEKKWDEHWQLLGSYTLSESLGDMPGQFELASGGDTGSDGNNVGVYLDDVGQRDVRAQYFDAGYGWLLDGLAGLGRADPARDYADDAGYYGYLPYHSFHNVKLNGSYHFDFGTILGLVYEFDSGHAWQKRGYVPLYGDFFAFPEGRGSRFMPPVHYVDARIAHRLDFDNGDSLELSIDIFNLFDFQTPVTYYENDDSVFYEDGSSNFGLVLYRQAPRSGRVGLKFTY